MNGNGNGSLKPWFLTALQTVGLPTVACIAIAWFANASIEWEREQLLPALQQNSLVLDKVNHTLERIEKNCLNDEDKK